MSTPDFISQDDSNFNPVRFYTAQDPYFYTIDNRPLQDLESNLKAARSGGGDAARRAAAMIGLNIGAMNSELVATNGRAIATTGLQVVRTGNNSVRISPGAYYEMRSVSATLADSIMKQALLIKNVDFTIPSPVTGGTSMVYTIEGQYIDLNTAAAASSQIPYVDAANVYLPSTYIHGELQLSIINGASAPVGTEVAAPTTDGKFPLYNLTLSQGQTNYKVELHPNAPRGRVSARTVTPAASTGAVLTTLNEMVAISLPKGDTSGVVLPSTMNENHLNPYLPIRLKITFSPSTVGGSVAFKMRYKAFAASELTSIATSVTAIDVAPVTSVADGIQTYTTAVSIPTSEFAGFLANRWVVNKEHLKIVLERISADATDTNAGDIRILAVTLFQ